MSLRVCNSSFKSLVKRYDKLTMLRLKHVFSDLTLSQQKELLIKYMHRNNLTHIHRALGDVYRRRKLRQSLSTKELAAMELLITVIYLVVCMHLASIVVACTAIAVMRHNTVNYRYTHIDGDLATTLITMPVVNTIFSYLFICDILRILFKRK